MSECGKFVSWWNGEYEGTCELPGDHGGAHYDGLSWFDDDGQMLPDRTGDIHAKCPQCGDQGPHKALFETGGEQVMTECGNCSNRWLVELDGSTGPG